MARCSTSMANTREPDPTERTATRVKRWRVCGCETPKRMETDDGECEARPFRELRCEVRRRSVPARRWYVRLPPTWGGDGAWVLHHQVGPRPAGNVPGECWLCRHGDRLPHFRRERG